MNEKARKRVAVVTGARRGIGFAIARRLHENGANVVLFDLNEEETRAAAHSLDPSGKSVMACIGDVSQTADVQAMAKVAKDTFGGIDILVNNAGISPKHDGKKAAVEEMMEDEWRKVLDVNLTGAFLCSRACLPAMRETGWGRIVNIASQAGRTRSEIAGAHYAASKAGMMGLARALASEVGMAGVTVNSIAPGRIVTPMSSGAPEEINKAVMARIPVGRLGTPEDVAAAVAFLASDDAGFISGATLDVNGGFFMI
jgi:3-oxoacyl-[acyl-carrier protein] reductase